MITNTEAKRVLLYGDSLVYGKVSGENARLDIKTRFSGVLQDLLGIDYEIIEEGLRARTIEGHNSFYPHRNGLEQFYSILGSHLPLDLVVIILGTNDCNATADKSAADIAASFLKYTHVMDEWARFLEIQKPQLLIVAPPTIDESSYDDGARAIFGDSASKRVSELPAYYKEAANQLNVAFLDLQPLCQPATGDGVHLGIEGNKQVADALKDKILDILS